MFSGCISDKICGNSNQILVFKIKIDFDQVRLYFFEPFFVHIHNAKRSYHLTLSPAYNATRDLQLYDFTCYEFSTFHETKSHFAKFSYLAKFIFKREYNYTDRIDKFLKITANFPLKL